MTRWLFACVLVLPLFGAEPAHAQFVEVCPIPSIIKGGDRWPLEDRRAGLLTEQIALVARGEQFNQRCRSVTRSSGRYNKCSRDHNDLVNRRNRLNRQVRSLCSELNQRAFGIAEEAAFKALYRQSLVGLDALLRAAATKDWSEEAKTGFILSTLAAMRGRFKRALSTLRIVKKDVPPDPTVDQLDDLLATHMIDAADHPGGPLVDPAEADQTVERFNRQAHGMILRASYLLGQGDYEGAIRWFTQAKKTARFASGTQKALNDALVWTRQLRAAANERLAPGQLDSLYRAQRDQAAAEQAWRLGHAMAARGLSNVAKRFYREAHRFFQHDGGYPGTVIARQRRDLERGRTQRSDDAAEQLATPHSRTDAVLDALEYGKGDWSRSLEYIRQRRKVLPDDPHLRDAENYLDGLSVGR